MTKWYTFDKKMPSFEDDIIVELRECKLCRYMRTRLRYGEGLGCYEKWCYAKDFIEEKINESNCKCPLAEN